MGQQQKRHAAGQGAQALMLAARGADAAKDFASAARLAAQATAANPGDAQAWRFLGVCHEKLGDYAASIAAYERALSLAGGGADLARDIARLATLLDLPALAERFLLRAWEQDPASPEIMNDLAYAYCAQGRFDDAIALLRASTACMRCHPKVFAAAAAVAALQLTRLRRVCPRGGSARRSRCAVAAGWFWRPESQARSRR